MTPEQWKRVKAVVADALDLPAGDRHAYIDRVCGSDSELRAEVDSLLSVAGDDDSLPDARLAIANAAAAALGMDHDAALEPETFAALESALDQQYEILRPLGRGGMGSVYLARDRALERFVAIKVLRPDVAALHGGRERFRREARIVAQLSHPGILSLHTFGEVRGLWYFVTGYVRGATLAERLRVEGRLGGEDARRIMAEVADALAYAHEHGVIHRDIKPANILLDEDSGRAVLADFGIAKLEGASDELTTRGLIVGTPSFMSPEQAAGNAHIDARSDIYSLGLVAHTMLAGRNVLPLDRLPTTVRRELAEVVRRCLSPDPDLRWANARALHDALVRADDANHAVPESLRDLPSFGAYATTWAIFWLTLAAKRRGPWDGLLLLLVAVVVPIGFTLHFLNLHRRGVPKRELARVAFWPPEWWGMWWPKLLRRPHDVWPRLPWPARAIRIVMSVFCIVLPALVLTHARDRIKLTIVAVAAAALVAAITWARRRALPWGDAVRVLFGSTSPSMGWMEPTLTQVLAPAHDRVRPPDPGSPADHRRAVGELVGLLPARFAALRADAPLLAHRLLIALDDCALEAASLARDASAAELDRLTAQLGALESEPRSGEDRAELTALVRRQLEIVRGMRVRAELIAQRRAKLFGLMRGLWAHLRAVSAPPSDESRSAAEMLARFDELRRETEAELSD